MVLGLGFLLLVSLVLSTALSAMGQFMTGLLPGFAPALRVVDVLISFVVVSLLFAMMFRFLPDAKIAWRDVWVGAVLTSLLFLLGRTLIGLYLGRGGVGSPYGAAGSLVALVV